jgi:hypothetical protein
LPEAANDLDLRAAETGETKSALVSAAILSTAKDRYLSPAILERVEALAKRRGDADLWGALSDTVDLGLDGLEVSIGKKNHLR